MAKKPPPLTAERVKKIAFFYLQRFDTSRGHLQDVLMRHAYRSHRAHQTDLAMAKQWVGDLLQKLEAQGVLDDQRYANHHVESLIARGVSPRQIFLKLQQKGVDKAHIQAALQALDDEMDKTAWRAAVTFAQKKKIGPWRRLDRPANQQKELATMARHGHSYGLARKIIAAESPDILALDGPVPDFPDPDWP